MTSQPNDRQLIIVMLFAGMVVGKYSGDRFPTVLDEDLSQSMEVMLFGRFCLGLGAASARVGTMVMIRDRFSGEQMARVLSVIMPVFILIPMLARQ